MPYLATVAPSVLEPRERLDRRQEGSAMDDEFRTWDAEFAEDVRQHGWSCANVSDHDPPFSYTIGLMHTWKHPEFIVFGVSYDNAYALLSSLVSHIRDGMTFTEPGIRTVSIQDREFQVGFRRVHPTQHECYLGFAMGFLTNVGRIGELEAVQAFWPDRDGKFPFDAGCDLGVHQAQPRLDLALTPREVNALRRRWGTEE